MSSSNSTDRTYIRWTWWIVLFAALVRLVRFSLPFPLWGDEIFVCQNFLDRDYRTILNQLENGQICPPLFLWLQLTAYRVLGSSEYAMRIFPLIAGEISIFVFVLLARRLLSPMATLIASGSLAMAIWPMTMSTFAKPYSFDLLASVVMLWAAVRWYQQRESMGRFVFLSVWMPVAILGSYTASFVAGGVSLALLVAVWRSGWLVKLMFIFANLGVGWAFWFDLHVGHEQLEKSDVPMQKHIKNFLYEYWQHGFPPENPREIPLWLLETHTGRMYAYPLGDAYGGSSATFLACLFGMWVWRRCRAWQLILLLTPIALNLFASVIHRYPYGACGRLSQYAAPSICILLAVGIEALIRIRHPRVETQLFINRLITIGFVLIGLGNLTFAFVKPYHDREALWLRETIQNFGKQTRNTDVIFSREPREAPFPLIRWHLRRLQSPVIWGDHWPDSSSMQNVWIVDYWMGNPDTPHTPRTVTIPTGWKRVDKTDHVMEPEESDDPHIFITIEKFTRSK